MVYGIACYCDEVHSTSLVPLAPAAHARALQHIETATAESSISTLQVAILLVLYTLFDPASGNFSQQLGFAIRLAIDLAIDLPSPDNLEQTSILSTLHKVIYCLENHVCGVFVRPTSLEEPATPLTFSTEETLEFLSTLYRVQSRIRKGIADDATCHALLAISHDAVGKLHPNIQSTLWETRLMLDPSAAVAVRLVAVYSMDRFIATFLTAYWGHKAGCLIVDGVAATEGPSRSELMLAYGNLVSLLGKWRARWDSAGTLLKSLQSRLKEDVRTVDFASPSTQQTVSAANLRHSSGVITQNYF
jgi:hypothetical protein